MRHRLGHLEPFVPEDTARRELPEFRMTHRAPGPGVHRGHNDLPEALVAVRAVEGHDRLCKTVDRPPIVALDVVGDTEVLVRQRLQDPILARCGQREGALGGGGRLGHASPACGNVGT